MYTYFLCDTPIFSKNNENVLIYLIVKNKKIRQPLLLSDNYNIVLSDNYQLVFENPYIIINMYTYSLFICEKYHK